MKRLFAFLLVFTMLCSIANAAMILEYDGSEHNYTGSVYELVVNGEKVETPLEPIIFNDRALVPVREVFEAMGAKVTYIGDTREITIELSDTLITMQIDSKYIFADGERKVFPDGVVPMLIAKKGESAKTMVPVRFASENLGMDVVFDGAKGIIYINNPEQTKPKPITTITSVKASYNEEDEVTIKVSLSEEAEKIGELTMIKSSGVLYLDVFGADYSCSHNISVKKGAVGAVRLGQHDEYTRIAIDTDEAKSYYKKLSNDKKVLTITVTGEGNFEDEPIESPSASPSAKPSASALPTAKPSPTPTPKPTPTPQAHLTGEKIVVLDAGHGGSDPGAIGTFDGDKYQEKAVNLAVAKKVKALLEKEGIHVEMTRTSDSYLTLSERSDFANKLGAAIFVSIHSNANESADINGLEVFYSKSNNSDRYALTSKKLAGDIYKNLITATKASQRGVKTEEWYVTRTSEMPAVLIELGFITNNEEAIKLYTPSYQDSLAEAISDAILSNIKTVKIPPQPKTAAEATVKEQASDENE